MTTATPSAVRKGGSWLLETTEPDAIYTQERISDEHRMMYKTALDFAMQEVMPLLPRLENKEWALSRQLIRRSGELGLLGTDTPEDYGGLELDKVSALVVAEGIARSASFTVTFGAMTGLAIMPLLLFGNEAQKKKYLPGLVSGELVGAYGLSESGSGLGRPGRARPRHAQVRRRLPAQRREDVDLQLLLRGRLHRLREGGRRALHRLHRRARVPGRQHGPRRAQDGPARLLDRAAHPPGRRGARREPARRNRQGPQGGLRRPELRPLQARGAQPRRREARAWARPRSTPRRASSSASPSRTSAPSSTSSARWSSAATRSRA